MQRILSSLVETGLAVQDPASRRYGLGPRTLVLGTAYQKRIDLRSVALPHMTHLRDLTGETVGLSVRVGDELLHIEQVESASALRRSFEIGRTLPLWCGAPSRLFLADLPADECEEIVRAPPSLRRRARPPRRRPSELLAAVEECRAQGLAAAYGETIAGVNTVAAGAARRRRPRRGHAVRHRAVDPLGPGRHRPMGADAAGDRRDGERAARLPAVRLRRTRPR